MSQQQQREHGRRYLSSFSKWTEKNLSEHYCHTVAAAVARHGFPLSDEDQREVDAWLDEKFPVRTRKEDRTDPPSVFDSLPTAW